MVKLVFVINYFNQQTFTYSNSSKETLEKGVKFPEN